MEERLDIGWVLKHTFTVLISNAPAFMVACGLAISPMIVLRYYMINADVSEGVLIVLVSIPIAIVLGQIATATITFGVLQQLRGRRASLLDCLSTALRRVLPVIGVAIVSGLIVSAAAILLIVPGIILWIMLYAAVPCVVIERPGVIGALHRSIDLTRGNRWRILGVALVVHGLINGALAIVAELLATGVHWVDVGVWGLISTTTAALAAIAPALVYYQLRSIKEYFDVDEVSAVFS